MKVPKFMKNENQRKFDVRKSHQMISTIKFEHDSSMVNIESINFVTPIRESCVNSFATPFSEMTAKKSTTSKPLATSNLDIIYNVTHQSSIKAQISPSIVKSIKSTQGSGRFTKSAQPKRLKRNLPTPYKIKSTDHISETPVRAILKVRKSIVTTEKTEMQQNDNIWTPVSVSILFFYQLKNKLDKAQLGDINIGS